MPGISDRRKTPRILVIDDDESVRATLEILLGEIGAEVVMASDGRQGVELFAAVRADLVITDVQMPVMNGKQTIAAIRRMDERVPIIAMSGSNTPGKSTQSTSADEIGADRVIEKPFDYDDLNALVGALLPRTGAPAESADAAATAAGRDGRRKMN